jgi:hypothetical protein
VLIGATTTPRKTGGADGDQACLLLRLGDHDLDCSGAVTDGFLQRRAESLGDGLMLGGVTRTTADLTHLAAKGDRPNIASKCRHLLEAVS